MLLKWILDALLKRYEHDQLSPGLVLAKLDDGYYASIARYTRSRYGRWVNKQIVLNTKGHPDPDTALMVLVVAWCEEEGITPPVKTIKESGERDRFQLVEIT